MIATPNARGPDEATDPSEKPPSRSSIVVIDMGNTTTALGICEGMTVTGSLGVPTPDRDVLADALVRLCRRFPANQPPIVVAATVIPDSGSWLRDLATTAGAQSLLLVGDDVPLPIPVAVREPDRVGTDRVCAAAAAFERTQHACTVVDFGTAVTVDLVDDRGTFAGGAILPGPALQARALAEWTAALPLVDLRPPEQAVGLDTTEAIRSGIGHGLPGAVRALVEQYATQLNTWPQVVATGGDLPRLMQSCDFIDTCVPDLTLMGVGLAYARHLAASQA